MENHVIKSNQVILLFKMLTKKLIVVILIHNVNIFVYFNAIYVTIAPC